MSEFTNIRGEFKFNLAGQDRMMRANFDCIERLETTILPKGIFVTLQEAMQNKGKFTDIVNVLHAGMVSAKDTRMTRSEVGQAILEEGVVNHIAIYIEFLTYCITGGKKSEGGSSGEQPAPDSQ